MPSFSLRVFLTLAVITFHTTLASARPVDNSYNSYSGKGGHAHGGNVTSVDEKPSLISSLGTILRFGSANAGNAGHANSGNAVGGGLFDTWRGVGGSNSGNAYSQDGGAADGGSVKGVNDALIDIGSNNAGHGGAASSGAAVGGGGGGGSLQDDYAGERDRGHKNYHPDDGNYRDDDHTKGDYEDYEDGGYGNSSDGKRHEHHRNDEDCDC